MKEPKIVIVGAGATGLTAARALREAGCDVTVLEKSRGLGGRIATRRRDGLQFDHGAPQAHVSQSLWGALGQGALEDWSPGRPARIGVPGMSDIVRPLAEGLDIRFQVEASALERAGQGWRILTAGETFTADQVILSIPAPQVINIAGAAEPSLQAALAAVAYGPCYTLMVAFETAPDWPAYDARPGGVFRLILNDSAKPGRPEGAACWVCHASDAWSRAHLETERPEAAALLLEALRGLKGGVPEVKAIIGHRWRYAQTTDALGQDHWANADGTLLAGGDWALGPLVEDAVRSGLAMAAAVETGFGAVS